MTTEEKLEILNKVFSPTAPIEQKDLFIGRIDQISNLGMTIDERGQHAVLYGERGVGKTSLSNLMLLIYHDLLTAKVTCNRTETFRTLWSKALKKVHFIKEEKGVGFKASQKRSTIQLDLFLPVDKDEIDSDDILNNFDKLSNKILFVFDEFDSIVDENTKVRFADTIKALSDNCPNITLLIVGIAENVIELIGSHPSLERCLKQIKMQRMSNQELGQIIDNGLFKLNMKIDGSVRNKIISYSSGFPHYTHLLSKYSAYNAILNKRQLIDNKDFNSSVKQALENANPHLRDSLQKATVSSKGQTKFEDVLCSVALAKTDEYDCSSITDILKEYVLKIEKEAKREDISYNLTTLCSKPKGEILEKVGISNNVKYRFKNPLIKAYIKLRLHNQKLQNKLPLK